MNADAHFQRRRQFVLEFLAQARHRTGHVARRLQGLVRADLGADAHTEQGHHAIAGELVGDAAGGVDGAAGGFEIAVQQMHHVVGQPGFRQPGEAAQVGEQHAQFALFAAHAFRLRQ